MKILVTGGYGFIGSAFIRKVLKNDRFSVINVDKLTYASNLESLKDYESNKNYKFYKTDICNKSEIKKIFDEEKPNYVVHFAAESHVDNSISSPEVFLSTNIIGTYNLLEASRNLLNEKFKLFLHISTDEVFGDLGLEGSFKEEDKYLPNSPYSASKASSDLIVRAWNKTFGLPSITTNCSNNFGPYQNKEKLIPTIINNALANKNIPIYGDGKNIRDWLFVEDHISALEKILENGINGESYNIGGGYEISNHDLAKVICRKLDSKFSKREGAFSKNISFTDDRLGHDFRYSINSNKIHELLDWKPSHSFDEALDKTIDWYLKYFENNMVKSV